MSGRRYGRILGGKTEARYVSCETGLVYEQVFAEKCPDGMKPVEKAGVYPVPGKDQEIAFLVRDLGDRIVKSGYLVKKGARYVLPRKLSKLSLELALLKRGLLGKWDAFIDGTFIPGTEYKLRRFFDQANNLSEDHAMCESFKGAVKSALDVSDAEFDDILNESIWTD